MAIILRAYLGELWRRPPSNLAPLDGLRAFSMLWILAFHLYWCVGIFKPDLYFLIAEGAPRWILHGPLAVDIFFVLSGFLISSFVFKEYKKRNTLDLRSFYIKRAFRLLPVYYFLLLFVTFVNITECKNVWANFIYINNYIPVSQTCMPWTWTLAIEEQFYLIFPLFTILLMRLGSVRHQIIVLAGLLVFAIGFNLAYFSLAQPPDKWVLSPAYGWRNFNYLFDNFYNNTEIRFGSVVVGVIAGYLAVYCGTAVKAALGNFRIHSALSIVSLSAIAITLITPDSVTYDGNSKTTAEILFDSLRHYIFSIGVGIGIVLLLEPKGIIVPIARFFGFRIFYPIAQLSYSMYLVHVIVINALYTRFSLSISTWPILALTAAGTTLAIAMLLYVLIEKPFMRIRQRLIVSEPA